MTDFAATLAAAATPHPIEQVVTQFRSLVALIVQLEAAKDHPYPRLRATLARLADDRRRAWQGVCSLAAHAG